MEEDEEEEVDGFFFQRDEKFKEDNDANELIAERVGEEGKKMDDDDCNKVFSSSFSLSSGKSVLKIDLFFSSIQEGFSFAKVDN